MSKLSRVLQVIFAENAGVDQIGQIGSEAAGSPTYTTDLAMIQSLTQYGVGLYDLTNSASQPPLIQDLNALYFLITSQLKYLFQAGVPEWITTEPYYVGSICQVAGVVYVSQSGADPTPNLGNNPTTDSGTNWKTLFNVMLGFTSFGTNWTTTLGAALGTGWSTALGTSLGTGWSTALGAALGTGWSTALGENFTSNVNHGIQTFTSNGTFTVPAGVTTVYISGCAAGGNGAGGVVTTNTNLAGGGGGGGGEWALKKSFSVTPGAALTVTIGAVGSDTSIGTFTLKHGGNASGSTAGSGGSGGSGTAGGDGGAAPAASYVNVCGAPGGRGFAGGGLGGVGLGAYNTGAAAVSDASGGGGGGGSYGMGGNGGAAVGNSYYGSQASGAVGGYGSGGGGGGAAAAANIPSSSSGAAGGPALLIVEW